MNIITRLFTRKITLICIDSTNFSLEIYTYSISKGTLLPFKNNERKSNNRLCKYPTLFFIWGDKVLEKQYSKNDFHSHAQRIITNKKLIHSIEEEDTSIKIRFLSKEVLNHPTFNYKNITTSTLDYVLFIEKPNKIKEQLAIYLKKNIQLKNLSVNKVNILSKLLLKRKIVFFSLIYITILIISYLFAEHSSKKLDEVQITYAMQKKEVIKNTHNIKSLDKLLHRQNSITPPASIAYIADNIGNHLPPKDIKLTSLHIFPLLPQRRSKNEIATSNIIIIEGQAHSPEIILSFTKNLSNDSIFRTINIQNIKEDKRKEGLFYFKITSTLN